MVKVEYVSHLTGWKYGSIGLVRVNDPFPFSTGHFSTVQRLTVLKYDGTTPYVTLTEILPLVTTPSGEIIISTYLE